MKLPAANTVSRVCNETACSEYSEDHGSLITWLNDRLCAWVNLNSTPDKNHLEPVLGAKII